MLSTVLILFFALVLFTYWFRYSCGLILRAHHNEAAAGVQARAHHLNFPDIRLKLRSQAAGVALAPLHELVQRDYQFLRFLVRHSSHSGIESLETRMLMLDYRVMHIWYLLMLRMTYSQARKALEEMNGVVGCLAQKVDSHAAPFLEA